MFDRRAPGQREPFSFRTGVRPHGGNEKTMVRCVALENSQYARVLFNICVIGFAASVCYTELVDKSKCLRTRTNIARCCI